MGASRSPVFVVGSWNFLDPEMYEWLYVTGRIVSFHPDMLNTYSTFQRYWLACENKHRLEFCDTCPLARDGCPYRGQWWVNIAAALTTVYGEVAFPLIADGKLHVFDPTTGQEHDSESSLLLTYVEGVHAYLSGSPTTIDGPASTGTHHAEAGSGESRQ